MLDDCYDYFIDGYIDTIFEYYKYFHNIYIRFLKNIRDSIPKEDIYTNFDPDFDFDF